MTESSGQSGAGPASPIIPSPDDDRVAVLAAYLRSNQGRFTDEALARAARDAGYSDAELTAAAALSAGSWQATDAAPAAIRRTNRGVVAAVAIAYVVALYLAITFAGSMSSDLSGIVALAGLLAGVVAWVLLRGERPSLAQGIGCGVILAIAIPIVAIVVIIGICIVAGTYPSGG